jgi:hypothetical protein
MASIEAAEQVVAQEQLGHPALSDALGTGRILETIRYQE